MRFEICTRLRIIDFNIFADAGRINNDGGENALFKFTIEILSDIPVINMCRGENCLLQGIDHQVQTLFIFIVTRRSVAHIAGDNFVSIEIKSIGRLEGGVGLQTGHQGCFRCRKSQFLGLFEHQTTIDKYLNSLIFNAELLCQLSGKCLAQPGPVGVKLTFIGLGKCTVCNGFSIHLCNILYLPASKVIANSP